LPNPTREGRKAALASAYNDRSVASRTRWTLPGPCSWTTASAIRRVIYSNDDELKPSASSSSTQLWPPTLWTKTSKSFETRGDRAFQEKPPLS
jgi:hypothetical protein